MSDACCGPQDPDSEPEAGPDKLWQVHELQLAALAAVLLAAGWLIGRTGAGPVSIGLELAAVVAAASTFVPDALRNLWQRRINVGTLMTIAAIGAVALGQFPEAALLGILFSIAEGLEHYAVTRTRRGLRALLSLVPPTASVIRNGTEITLAPEELVIGDVMVLRPGERAAWPTPSRTSTSVAKSPSDTFSPTSTPQWVWAPRSIPPFGPEKTSRRSGSTSWPGTWTGWCPTTRVARAS